MVDMENSYLSSSLNAVSFDLNTSWAAKSWDPAYSFRQERARFQQKQLQEKEEKLLRLYEEQQERAMARVGTRVQSGGSSVSSGSSVGVGKVRQMFQARRGNSEARLGAALAGRDKSYPLKPIPGVPTRSLDVNQNARFVQDKVPASWTNASRRLNRHNSENDFQAYLDGLDEEFHEERERVGVRRTQSQVRGGKPNVLYFGGSHTDLRFSDELDFGQSFHVIDDHFDNFKVDTRGRNGFDNVEEDYFVKSFNNKREFYESRVAGASDEFLNQSKPPLRKLPNVGLDTSFAMNQKVEAATPGKYKTYVSGNAKKTAVRNGTVPGKSFLPSRQTNGPASQPSKAANGGPSSPVRKTTPMPAAVTPPQHLVPKEPRKINNASKVESIPEVTPPIPASRTTVPRFSPAGSNQQRATANKMPTSKTPVKSATSNGQSRLVSQPDLVNCKICGRHFAQDRVSKHEAICQKSSNAKRKVFDAVQQRVRGTEAEKFVRKGTKSGAQSGVRKASRSSLQTNWRKKHEEFISSIRAAKEVQAHLKRGGKLSDLPPPPPSDYSDYIQCPHCSRRFNNAAAERHIPKCATMIHNKPNPNLQKKQTPCTSNRGRGPPSATLRGQK